MPVHFGFEKLLEEVRQGESGSGVVAARQLETTVERLIFSAAENMESKVNEFVETVIDKVQPGINLSPYNNTVQKSYC